MEALRSKTDSLMNQQRVASDYLSDIEIQLETWHAQQESFTIAEGTLGITIDEEEQERPVQELILIDRSLGKLILLQEKLDLLLEKNNRLLNKATLKI